MPNTPFVRAGRPPGPARHDGAHVLVRAADTAGAWAMAEHAVAPGDGVTAHVHRVTTEALYVAAGEVRLTVDGRAVRLLRGDVAAIPPGVVHDYRNAADAPATLLVLYLPAGLERRLEVHPPDAAFDHHPPDDGGAR